MRVERKSDTEDCKQLQYIDVDFEVKALHDEDDEFFRFEGLASTFGNIDMVDDVVIRGAFVESLQTKTPVVLWQHDSHNPLGMPEEIRETEDGLFIRARLPKSDSFVTDRVIPQMKVGSIRSMSIGFRVVERDFTDEGIRLLKKLDLVEISLVTFPANLMAAVSGFKSADKFYNVEDVKALSPRELEDALRESGMFSKAAATLIVSFAKQGEPVGDDDGIKSMLSTMLAKTDDHLKAGEISKITQKVNNHARSYRA